MTEQAIILVAGLGQRMLPLTEQTPKCLVPVNGTPLLVNALNHFAAVGVKRVLLVVGHLAGRFSETIGPSFRGLEVRYVENSRYAATNSMYSLLLALREGEEDTWVLEGDVFFERAVLSLEAEGDFLWYGDAGARHMDGAFLLSDAQGYVRDLKIIREKAGRRPEGHFKSIGLLKLRRNAAAVLRQWLEQGGREDKVKLYYDLIVKEHIGEFPIRLVDVAGHKWFEIDDLEDLKKAERLFGP